MDYQDERMDEIEEKIRQLNDRLDDHIDKLDGHIVLEVTKESEGIGPRRGRRR